MEDFLDAAKNKLGESVENVAALAAKAGEVGQEALGVLAEAASADVESYGEGMMPPPEPETPRSQGAQRRRSAHRESTPSRRAPAGHARRAAL